MSITPQKGDYKWLTEGVLPVVARRVTPLAAGLLLGVLGTVGLVPPEVVAACQAALGL